MIGGLAQRLFGSANQRLIKEMQKPIDAIGALEADLGRLSDSDLRARTDTFRARIKNGEEIDALLVDAFATVREASKRTLGQRHFDVQLIGGIVLHEGRIAEMKTGEGKTLSATLPVYLNALEGKGVHVVTVNDYLARRDSEWMGEIYRFLGLEAGCIVHGLSDDERRAAYAADVTYGTNNEFGFDYLRDNMKFQLASMVQRPFNFAIVDEVDSILIDEARTPLIISGPTQDQTDLYQVIDRLIPGLEDGDFEIDEKSRTVALNDAGVERMEKWLRESGQIKEGGLYDIDNVTTVHHVNQALRAHKLFTADVDYIVKDDKVVIIDEFTGRMMEGRRYSDGLHQALEAKEGVSVQNENQTLASITFQNYFRLYPKLAGMTGTAATEASEFADIYGLDVTEVPTNEPMVRVDNDDEVYRTAAEKYRAILGLIEEARARGQPVLVGTVSIEKSEHLSELLKAKNVPHKVLNARYHAQEATIIAQAGRFGAITIATNMAGRGTDIQLGGNAEMRIKIEIDENADTRVKEQQAAAIEAEVAEARAKVVGAGGLYIMGTERHESRRIDNQLRGRSGRQGDPGASKFFLSLEDDLMRIFGSERMDGMLRKLGLQEDEAVVHPWINKALEKAQQKVEARNYEIRKNLLKFDDVMNDQRKVIYAQRIDLMEATDVSDTVTDMRHEIVDAMVERHIPEKAYSEQWDAEGLKTEVLRVFGLDLPVVDWAKEEGIAGEEMRARVADAAERKMAEKAANYTPDVMRVVEKSLLLQLLDQHWKDHLLQLDHLRSGIGLRAYAQRDPLNEYKGEAFSLFEALLDGLREAVTTVLAHIELRLDEPQADMATRQPAQQMRESHVNPLTGEDEARPPPQLGFGGRAIKGPIDPADPATWGKVPRNAPCPCGTGKKYKHCHGKP
jgi:preprotein translocase subunit SecA